MAPRQYITINKEYHPRANAVGHVLEHIVVAEESLGRHLANGETVHHIDGNKKNNAPENLMVFATPGDHTAFHHGGEAYKDGDTWKTKRKRRVLVCEACGKSFFAGSKRLESKRHFCSNKCRGRSTQRTTDTNYLVELLKRNNGNFSKTARELNVTGSAIAHRLQHAGLPFHSKDYKLMER